MSDRAPSVPAAGRTATALRVVLAAGALAAAAWFALGTRQAIDTGRATSIVQTSARLSPGQARRADGLLRSAAFLNPDRQVDLLRSQVALATGQRATARRLAAQVTRSEPQNANAWYQLLNAGGPTAARAFQQLARLVRTVPEKR